MRSIPLAFAFLLIASVAHAEEVIGSLNGAVAQKFVALYRRYALLPPEKKQECITEIAAESGRIADVEDREALAAVNAKLAVDGCLDKYSYFDSVRAGVILPPRRVRVERFDAHMYISIPAFDRGTAEVLRAAFDELGRERVSGLRGVVLDLRGNPGGLLDELRDVLNTFFSPRRGVKFMRVSVVPKADWEPEQVTSRSGLLAGYRLRILSDENCMSACEWMIKTLRHEWYPLRTTVLGYKTGGKAVIQCLRQDDPVHLTVTCGEWTLPDGTRVQGVGIESDRAILLDHCGINLKCVMRQALRD